MDSFRELRILTYQENHMSQKKAFTLIELLVVIAIIAILAAILFPVFAQAKAAAKKASATSNLKQNALAVIMYSDANDDTYPQSVYFAPPKTAGGRPVMVLAFDAIQPFTKNLQIFDDPGEPGAINVTNILQNDLGALGGPFVSDQNIAKVGVAFNFALFEDPSVGVTSATDSNENVRSAGSVPLPSDTIMFYSAGYTKLGSSNKYRTKFETGFLARGGSPLYITPAGPFSRHNFAGAPRHNDTLVVNFADGSVRAQPATRALAGQGVDFNVAGSTTLINSYILPFDLNGIPEVCGEPRF